MASQQKFTFIDFRGQQDAVDASTLSRIRSHSMRMVRKDRKVQAQREAEARRQSRKPLLAIKDVNSNSIHPGHHAEASTNTALPDDALQTEHSSERNRQSSHDTTELSNSPEEGSLETDPDDKADAAQFGHLDHIILMNAQISEVLDPFHSFPLPLDGTIARSVKSYYRAASWKWESPPEILLPDTFADPCLLHSFLTLASIKFTQAHPAEQFHVLWHQTKTLQYLTPRMSNVNQQTSDEVIWAVARIAMFSAYFVSPSISCKHMQALATMVELRGGLDQLGYNGQIRYMIEGVVLGGAPMWWDSVPPVLRLPYGLLEKSAISNIIDDKILLKVDTAFTSPALSSFLSPALVDIFIAIASLNATADQVIHVTPAIHHLLTRASNKLAFRLIYTGASCPVFVHCGSSELLEEMKPHMAGEREIQLLTNELFRLFVTLFMWFFQREIPILTPARVISSQIEAILCNLDLGNIFPEESWQKDFLLWGMVVVGSTATCHTQEQFYLQMIRSHFTVSSYTVVGVQDLCRRFLWMETACPRQVSVFWEKVQRNEKGDVEVGEFTGDVIDTALPKSTRDMLQYLQY